MKIFELWMMMAGGYHVSTTITATGDGGWDYLSVDSAASRLYVSHATKVVVIDLKTNAAVGEIPDTPGVHGTALASALNKGFISAGRADSIVVFDLKTLKETARIKVGANPDAILYDPASKHVLTFNGRSNDITVVDAVSGAVLKTIPAGGKPEFAADAGGSRIYVNIEDTSEMMEIDAAKMMQTGRYKLTGCEDPSGLAMDVKNRRLFSVCANKVMVISDPAAKKVIATLPIGKGSDGAAFDPSTGLAFSSNGGDGTVTVVKGSGGRYEVAETAKSQPGARTIAVDPATHKLYLPTADFLPAAEGKRPAAKPGTFRVIVVEP